MLDVKIQEEYTSYMMTLSNANSTYTYFHIVIFKNHKDY